MDGLLYLWNVFPPQKRKLLYTISPQLIAPLLQKTAQRSNAYQSAFWHCLSLLILQWEGVWGGYTCLALSNSRRFLVFHTFLPTWSMQLCFIFNKEWQTRGLDVWVFWWWKQINRTLNTSFRAVCSNSSHKHYQYKPVEFACQLFLFIFLQTELTQI